jgi:hypothetical protein
MRTDIANWCRDFQTCQRSNPQGSRRRRYSPSRCPAAGSATYTWTWLARIQHTTTTAYHPQSNGLVEKAHHQLKEGLKTRLASHEWLAHLLWVLLGMRTMPKDDSAISSAELVYGAPLVLPGKFVDAAEPPAAEPPATDFLEHVRPGPVSIPTRPIRQPPQAPNELLQWAKWVYIR